MEWRNAINTNRYNRKALRISSRWSRFSAWRQGGSDGKLKVYGCSTTDGFENRSHWLTQHRLRAESIYNKAYYELTDWKKRFNTRKDKLLFDKSIVDQRIASKNEQQGSYIASTPELSRAYSAAFLVFLFIIETSITFASLVTTATSLSNPGFQNSAASQLAVSIAAGLVLTICSHVIAISLRMLPLNNKFYGISRIIVSLVLAVFVLIATTILRTSSPSNPSHEFVVLGIHLNPVFMTIGLGLVIVGIFISAEHEYSGRKYGLAKLERRSRKIAYKIINNESAINRIDIFIDKLRDVVEKQYGILSSTYKARYARQYAR